jgi:hypothetical protein
MREGRRKGKRDMREGRRKGEKAGHDMSTDESRLMQVLNESTSHSSTGGNASKRTTACRLSALQIVTLVCYGRATCVRARWRAKQQISAAAGEERVGQGRGTRGEK